VTCRIICEERDGQWIARAVRQDTGDPFGIECAGPTNEAESATRNIASAARKIFMSGHYNTGRFLLVIAYQAVRLEEPHETAI